jgi:predicted ArsR family transcriptional regulator
MDVERKEQGTTRQNIMNLLRRQGQMTAGELSDALGIGAVGVRQHLALLERDGLVEIVGLRRSVGRPSHLYTLTMAAEQRFPKYYDRLALDILGHLSTIGGNDAVIELLDARRHSLRLKYAPRLAGKSRAEQVQELCAILDEQGYMCEYERLEDGSYLLIEHNCPVDCIAREHTQLCSQELTLYQELLGVPMIRDSTISSGEQYCRYHIPAEHDELSG